MGKIEDMQRQRAQQLAENERRRANAAKASPVVVVEAPAPVAEAPPVVDLAAREPAQPTRPTRPTTAKKQTSAKTGDARSEQGKCPDCGKMKPVQNGLMASHQKGFGKACSGSRKKAV